MEKKTGLLAVALVAAIILMFTAPILVKEDQQPTDETLLESLQLLGLAIISSVVTNFLGYLKTKPVPMQGRPAYELRNLLFTIFVGVVIGIITYVMGWDYLEAQTWAGNVGITVWLYWLAQWAAQKITG